MSSTPSYCERTVGFRYADLPALIKQPDFRSIRKWIQWRTIATLGQYSVTIGKSHKSHRLDLRFGPWCWVFSLVELCWWTCIAAIQVKLWLLRAEGAVVHSERSSAVEQQCLENLKSGRASRLGNYTSGGESPVIRDAFCKTIVALSASHIFSEHRCRIFTKLRFPLAWIVKSSGPCTRAVAEFWSLGRSHRVRLTCRLQLSKPNNWDSGLFTLPLTKLGRLRSTTKKNEGPLIAVLTRTGLRERNICFPQSI